jgi:hypothetical protein
MRAPNGQSLAISFDREWSLITICEVLRRCDQQFEAAVGGKPLRFVLSYKEESFLSQYYLSGNNIAGQLKLFLNEALERIQAPYRIRTVMTAIDSFTFSCHIERIKPTRKQ